MTAYCAAENTYTGKGGSKRHYCIAAMNPNGSFGFASRSGSSKSSLVCCTCDASSFVKRQNVGDVSIGFCLTPIDVSNRLAISI